MFAQRVVTTNDTNGNPRRGWIIYADNGAQLAFVAEGYHGERKLREVSGLADITEGTVALTITPGQYRKLNRDMVVF